MPRREPRIATFDVVDGGEDFDGWGYTVLLTEEQRRTLLEKITMDERDARRLEQWRCLFSKSE